VRQVVAYLLDANVVSEMMRPIPEPRVAAVLDRIDEGAIGLASITIWEILDGVGRLDPGKRRDDLAERFQGVLDDVFDERILDWTVDDARTCAELMERKRRTGEPLDDHLPDAMLAGMAVRRGLTVVTRNTRDFRNTGAAVVDPWTGVRR
jgi:predicted nucleic acid-binding protein